MDEGDSRSVKTEPEETTDVCTTLFNALEVDHNAVLMDPLQWPNHLLNGEVIAPLYSGRIS